MKISVIIFAASFLSACGGGGGDAPTVKPDPIQTSPPALRIFLFAGQSSMAAADAIISPSATQNLIQAGLQTDADRSALFSMATPTLSYAWGDIRGHQGTHNGEITLNGVPVMVHGPEVGFNRALGGNTGIIKYSNNFTAFENGRSAWVKPGSLWAKWQVYVDAQLATVGKPYVVSGVVWLQGIDDAVMARDKAAYRADLLQIAADVRAKYGPIPFIIGRSVDSIMVDRPHMAAIREAQNEVGAMPGNGLASADDLGPYVGGHHLSAASHLVFGQRYAAEYMRLR